MHIKYVFDVRILVNSSKLIKRLKINALGCYGYYSLSYIKLISAYIAQISGVKDELKF